MNFIEIEKIMHLLYSGVIYDALYFDLNYRKSFILDSSIKSIQKSISPCFGYAFTCKGGQIISEKEIDDEIRLKIYIQMLIIQLDQHTI